MFARLVAIALRLSGMGTQFLAGIAITWRAGHADVVAFFTVTAAVPLLMLALGLELHTATDRLIAKGLSTRTAMWWLLRREAAWTAVVTLGVVCYWVFARTGIGLVGGILMNAIIGLAVQEIFRALIMMDAQAHANAMLFIRNALPFGLVAGMAVFSDFRIMDLLVAWAAAGVVALFLGIWAASRRNHWRKGSVHIPPGTARAHVRAFLPATLSARTLLSADILFLGATSQSPALVGVYGNCNSVISAFFTLADVGVVQWRMRSVLSGTGAAALRRFRREMLAIGLVGSLAVVLVGGIVTRLKGLVGSPSAIWVVCVLAVAATVIVYAQAPYLEAYAAGRDDRIRGSYALALLPFVGALVLVWVLNEPAWAAVGKAVAWTLLVLALRRRDERGEKGTLS